MGSDLLKQRETRRSVARSVAVAFSVAFYLALVPVVVLLSGPVYHALQCTLGSCDEPGTDVTFVLSSRGALQANSSIRLPNGDPVGRIIGFRASGDERYSYALGRVDAEYAHLLEASLRCEVSANFNIQMDADLVVSTCPDLDLPYVSSGERLFVCGSVDHFARMGQEIRRFVLDHVRPGEQPVARARLSGPCGADNEAATTQLRAILAE